jgi:hypothetical protein
MTEAEERLRIATERLRHCQVELDEAEVEFMKASKAMEGDEVTRRELAIWTDHLMKDWHGKQLGKL